MCITLFFSAAFIVKMFLMDGANKRKRQIQRITLVKPPPPKIKEKPPEPEVKKQEEIMEAEPEDLPPEEIEDTGKEDMPPGEDLGLDSEGTGGADSFGLKAKKGGRSLIGGSRGSKSLLRRYAWYTRILQDEIRQKVNKYLEDKKEIPGGKYKMVLEVKLDSIGNMVLVTIFKSSGNFVVDNIVEQAIIGFKVSEIPPEEMPKKMKIKVTFKS